MPINESQVSPSFAHKTEKETSSKERFHPAVILMAIVLIAVAMTYIFDSGVFEREGKSIVPGTYQVLEKSRSAWQLFGVSDASAQASPVGLMDALLSIPLAIDERAGMIFMVLFIGGMFGVLNRSGAIESGLERMLTVTRGNIYLLIPPMMIVFSMGSTFLGMAKEYLLVIPMVVAMVERLGMSRLMGLAIVAIPVKVGYLASITNPYALPIAQPLVGVPVFSGMGMRVFVFVLFMSVGVLFMLNAIRKQGHSFDLQSLSTSLVLSTRHKLILGVLALGVAFLVYASQTWHWKYEHLSAYYLALGIVFAILAGLSPSETAVAFVDGMKKVLIAGVLIALATSVAMILEQGKVLDTIVYLLAGLVGDNNASFAAYGMFVSQLIIDVLIPSTSGQAAVTMPILGPLGQLSGVDPHTTVLAFLLGNGLTNIITPTSSGLLIFLAAAQVGWGQWAKFILPLWLLLCALSLAVLYISLQVYS
ncbi:YfcC family protein [Halomonas sp. HNIBRBA4712]|uniref:YfcC family protein n=1 Tax=Halomonas sp. HNIBRBA4712 TaxID=3373087 RepID=UPI0037450A81